MTPRPHTPSLLVIAIAAALAMAALGVARLTGQAPAASLQVISPDGRRALPLATSGSRDMVALDDLAALFKLTVRDDAGGITVGYGGRRVVLTADQTIASVNGRLISLPAPLTRSGNRWLVPLEFIPRALAPIYDARLELRRPSRLLLVGTVRVPRVEAVYEPLGASGRVRIDIDPAAPATVTQLGQQRLLVRVDADAIDPVLPPLQPDGFVQAIRAVDSVSLAIELGPRFSSFRAATQPGGSTSRLVVEIASAQTEAAPPPPAPAIEPPARDAPLATTTNIRTIAIDPGHGGADNGARGAAGTREKDVTLAVARRLRSAIESRLGMRVLMTRDGDTDVSLSDRTALANNNKADLFISLHANASFRRDVSGATVYTASFDQSEISRRVSEPERLPVFGGGTRVLDIVPWNLAQIPHRERSATLASIVVESFTNRVPLSARPIDRAPLRVLESANMPAVLLEIGYLTNAEQERAVAGADLQGTVAQALVDAIMRFRERMLNEGTR
ncbi:MAG: N-acetylmuramoyl-L-alanine amidase [Vicinamibacterales bacterium]